MERSDPTAALAAIGHETRYAALKLLVAGGPDGIGAGELARSLKLAPSTLTFHMGVLRHAGLVTLERQGRAIVYRVDKGEVEGVLHALVRDLTSRS